MKVLTAVAASLAGMLVASGSALAVHAEPATAAPSTRAEVQPQATYTHVIIEGIRCKETSEFRRDEIYIKFDGNTIYGPRKIGAGHYHKIDMKRKLRDQGSVVSLYERDPIGADDYLGQIWIPGTLKNRKLRTKVISKRKSHYYEIEFRGARR